MIYRDILEKVLLLLDILILHMALWTGVSIHLEGGKHSKKQWQLQKNNYKK